MPVVTFEAYIENILTKKLNAVPKVHEDVYIRIANVSFAFDNTELISLLSERGSLLASGKFDKVEAVDNKIEKLAKN